LLCPVFKNTPYGCALQAAGDTNAYPASPPPHMLCACADALEKWEQHAASESGLMNIILGNTCFTSGETGTSTASSIRHSQHKRCCTGALSKVEQHLAKHHPGKHLLHIR
jgi:hypothetical protein